MARIRADATAFAHRDCGMMANILAANPEPRGVSRS